MPCWKPVDEHLEVALQVGEGDAVLVHVDLLGPGGEPAQQREVAAAAAHHLDHEAALRGDGRGLDLVHRAHDVVEGGVAADRQLRGGQVVVDRGGQADHRQVEGGEALALGVQLGDRRVARPAPDHQDAVELVLLDLAGDLVELAVGGLAPVRAELGPAAARPAVDAHPAHLEKSPSTRPRKPLRTPRTWWPRSRVRRSAARTAVFMPGAGPPPCMNAKRKRFFPSTGGWGSARTMVRRVRRAEPKPRPAQRHRPRVVAALHALGDLEGLVDALHERLARHPVVLHPDELGLAARGRGEQLLDRGVAEQRAHVAVEGARRAAPLDVAEDRDAHVLVRAAPAGPCGRARR